MISLASTLRRTTAALALTILLGACSDSMGPGEIAVPSVAGAWFGTFRDAPVSLQLGQSGDQVTGTLVTPTRSYPVTGTVNAAGLLTFGTPLDMTSCDAYSSSRGLMIGDGGATLAGPAQRASRSIPCDGPPGRVLVSQGLMELSRN
jgi:hypothetical protein